MSKRHTDSNFLIGHKEKRARNILGMEHLTSLQVRKIYRIERPIERLSLLSKAIYLFLMSSCIATRRLVHNGGLIQKPL